MKIKADRNVDSLQPLVLSCLPTIKAIHEINVDLEKAREDKQEVDARLYSLERMLNDAVNDLASKLWPSEIP